MVSDSGIDTIKITWSNKEEEFVNIDISSLITKKRISTQSFLWHNAGCLFFEYKVTAELKNGCLNLTYHQSDNSHLQHEVDEFFTHGHFQEHFRWGTNKLIDIEKEQGICEWRHVTSRDIHWEKRSQERTWSTPSKGAVRDRDWKFREMILSRDKKCVLSKEKTKAVLEAAHIFPVAKSEKKNDYPNNGIILRSDLHKLFDANYFFFDGNGNVLLNEEKKDLSKYYRDFLNQSRLPCNTLLHVKTTLEELERNRNKKSK